MCELLQITPHTVKFQYWGKTKGEMKMRVKICPLIHQDCLRYGCAWWTNAAAAPAVGPDGSPAGDCCLVKLAGGEVPKLPWDEGGRL